MITTVDTNVLLDIFGADVKFGEALAEAIRQCVSEGALVGCEAVWAETATAFQSSEKFRRAIADLMVTSSRSARLQRLRRRRPRAITAPTAAGVFGSPATS